MWGESNLVIAERHALRGRHMVSEQEVQVASIKAAGGDPKNAEGLLGTFKRSLAILEDDLCHASKSPHSERLIEPPPVEHNQSGETGR
jgi:hypothetical protein